VVVDTGLLPGLLAPTGSRLAAGLLAEDVAHLGAALSLAGVLAAAVVEAEVRQLERADRHLDDLVAVGGDDRLLADDPGQVALDRLLDLLIVASLVDRSLAVERPVVLAERDRKGHRASRRSVVGGWWLEARSRVLYPLTTN